MAERFVLFKKLARGGMAEIYLGKLLGQDGFERMCCYKRILPHLAKDTDFIEMFRDEAHIGKRLQHANIVRVEGFEEVDDSYAIIMEFVAGADLRTLLSACEQQNTRPSIPMAAYIIAEAARGLHYAHIKTDDVTHKPLGIVHRDISPQNILVSFEGEVKVTDFGIAEAENKLTETKTGIVKGKFSYMSPEQISAQTVDARTDVFALSILLWEMLAMRRLFHAETEVATIQLVRDCVIPMDLATLNPEVDEDLQKIVFKGLAKDVGDRYKTAALFEKDLRRYLNKHYPDFTADDLSEFLKRNLREKREELLSNIQALLSQKGKIAGPEDKTAIKAPSESSARSEVPYEEKEDTDFRLDTGFTGQRAAAPTTQPEPGPPPQPRAETISPRPSTVRPTPPPRYQATVPARTGSFARFLLSLLLIGAVAAGAFYFYQQRKTPPSIQWEISTVPNTVQLELDGVALFESEYARTPLTLRKVKDGSHQLTIKRPGFESETITATLSKGESTKSEVVLKQLDKMAPLRISLKSGRSVKIRIDDGIFQDTLGSQSPVNVDFITFGEEHTLYILDAATQVFQFQCVFTPRAQSWLAPFLVVIDSEQQKCSYPLR
ncbi:MAG: serine/threonine protein kinase [Deltaproteobacteria bacterium]|nr:serine/threonine protein kinase [Deltaproteobacteria bacterium]